MLMKSRRKRKREKTNKEKQTRSQKLSRKYRMYVGPKPPATSRLVRRGRRQSADFTGSEQSILLPRFKHEQSRRV